MRVLSHQQYRSAHWYNGRWSSLRQEYTEELYKKDLHNQDNCGVITHLEPDVLECEVKWALENIIMNKAKWR